MIMPNEVVSQAVAQQYLPTHQIQFDSVFLRWDGEKAVASQPVMAAQQLDKAGTQQFFMQLARTEAEKSADWWRQVGVAVIKDGQVILTAYNHHLPSEQQPYIDGDPRADFHKGDHIELSTAIHAEAAAIAEAARQGLSLADTTMYVTTFPCPNCAKLIAQSGVKELVFADGYSMLDGEQVLKTAGVTITQLTTNP
jgi:dCMP deaminase